MVGLGGQTKGASGSAQTLQVDENKNMSVPSRYLTPPFNGDDEKTRELLRRLVLATPPPDIPKRLPQPVDLPVPLITTTHAGDLPTRLPVESLGAAPLPNPNQPTKGFDTSLGAPPPMDYSDLAVQRMEDVVKNAPVQRVKPDGSFEFVDRAPAIPPVRIPQLTDASLADSVVQVPQPNMDASGIQASDRVDPTARDLPRKPGEGATDYAARKHREFEDELRTESPYSRVKETATGTTVDAPRKPHGTKQRAMAGLMLALDTLGSGVKAGGGPGALGSAIVSGLTGVADPGLALQVSRQRQIAAADVRAKQLDEQQSREAVTAERQARTADLSTLPQRRKDEERDKRIAERERNWERLVTTGGFDPVNNPEHRRIQLEAANDGQILPSTPAKAKPARVPEKQLITNDDGSQTLFEREPGESNWHQAKGIPQSARKPSEAQDNRIAEADAKRQEYQAEEQQNRKQAEEYQQRSSDLEAQAITLDQQNAPLSKKRTAFLTEGEKASIAKAKELHTQAREAATKATEFWNKRAEADNKARTVPQLKTRTTGKGVGKTYTTAEVRDWAKAKGMSRRAARKVLESEGAMIK